MERPKRKMMIVRLKGKKWKLPDVLPCGALSKMFFYDVLDYREPRKGEYFISGAIPELYKAPNDLSTKYLTVTKIYPIKAKTIYERI